MNGLAGDIRPKLHNPRPTRYLMCLPNWQTNIAYSSSAKRVGSNSDMFKPYTNNRGCAHPVCLGVLTLQPAALAAHSCTFCTRL